MSSEPACQLHIEERPASGPWNMALDEALLIDAIEHGACHLRFYRWSEPTLSLGYFQKPEERGADPALADLPAVRRLSGGGAILHDDEWTYSCAVPATHELARRPVSLYDVVHAVFVETLRTAGFEIEFRGESRADDGTSFLCFTRGDARDLLCRGHKVLGSAQRRRRGAVLQHGSLLLHASPHAPSLPGLLDLHSERTWSPEIVPGLANGIGKALGTGHFHSYTDTVSAAAGRLVREKYAFANWGQNS